ncbi:hypothetical protein LCGC14_1368510 [marine sediment metagenome]|uniref:Uncharacterized protein n=1 Tax=marine sediment metagenome TaxID=412755 RepID=A0A0F9N820_9ZZZZ
MPLGIGYGKDKKLRRSTAKKKDYLKANEHRIARGDKNTPTYAQWASASKTERGLMKAGVGQKRLRRMRKK